MDPDSAPAKTLLQTMVLMMMADGEIATPEVSTIGGIFHRLTGHQLTAEQVSDEVDVAMKGGRKLFKFLKKASGHLDEKSQEMIIMAAIHVAGSDGSFGEGENEILGGIGSALGVAQDRVDALIQNWKDGAA